MALGGLCRYCLKRSSKAWPTVLMMLWARPSQHSKMWQAVEGTCQRTCDPSTSLPLAQAPELRSAHLSG